MRYLAALLALSLLPAPPALADKPPPPPFGGETASSRCVLSPAARQALRGRPTGAFRSQSATPCASGELGPPRTPATRRARYCWNIRAEWVLVLFPYTSCVSFDAARFGTAPSPSAPIAAAPAAEPLPDPYAIPAAPAPALGSPGGGLADRTAIAGPGAEVTRWVGSHGASLLSRAGERARFRQIMTSNDLRDLAAAMSGPGEPAREEQGWVVSQACLRLSCADRRGFWAIRIADGLPIAGIQTRGGATRIFGLGADGLPPVVTAAIAAPWPSSE
ncbi:MAG: hypothetical protein AAGE76_11455 [Pseudomonadota bacterium]